jgi:prophage tail gpP-like protein
MAEIDLLEVVVTPDAEEAKKPGGGAAFNDRFGTWGNLTQPISTTPGEDIGRVASEIAELIVRGTIFDDWESVWVQHRWNEIPIFRFTAAERDPVREIPPGSGPQAIWPKLQFRPGDSCTVKLGGQLAVTGVIETRQIAYDAHNHGVMLIGRGIQSWAARSSVMTETMNFDGKNLKQIADEVFVDYPVKVETVGSVDMTPFKRCHAEHGETNWDFIERLCRPRGVVLGTDHENNFLLIGDHTKPIFQQIIEGENVIRMNCTITEQWKFFQYNVDGSGAANDSNRGGASTNQRGTAEGTAVQLSRLLQLAEQPVWGKGELVARAKAEANWHETSDVQVSAVVQGWLRDGKEIWRAGDEVIVTSPMALLNGQRMKIEVVTYTQDRQNGTITTLDIVNPGRLRGKPLFKVPDAVSNTDTSPSTFKQRWDAQVEKNTNTATVKPEK